ncbi:MAG TPA: polysaccharide biosynthesis/export family protein [Ferruginibacter sp.]|jgi:polysaccharide export outer membrane protein|nr:polysaccharide biosynthesis/export family protein [Ferruginibacter sp.]
MRKSLINRLYLFVSVLFLAVSIVSCATNRNVAYFKNIPDSAQLITINHAKYTEPTIQTDDILTIIVQTVDPLATGTINAGNIPLVSPSSISSLSLSASQQAVSGYLVNKEGNVEIPVLGKIKLLGLTTNQAKEVIRLRATDFFKDPTVIVRYANFKITVTGEVARPSIYVFPNEKVTILDALSIAGDLTIYGKRDNILLLRESKDNSITEYRINLNKTNILNAPYYYLQQNDFIYVEPSKGKAAANDLAQARTATIVVSILTLLIVIASRINF